MIARSWPRDAPRRRGTISVVIPSYNAARFLPEAIASVRAQTRPVAELIVIDDGSSDGSLELARGLGATCLSTGVNSGPSAARNLGWRVARGELVAFLDADDFWDPTHLESVAALREAHPQAVLAFALTRTVGGAADETPRVPATLPPGLPGDAFWPLLERNFVAQSAVIVRRAALAATGGYDEAMRHSEDYDLWLSLSRRAPFVCTGAVTVNYRRHDAQVTQEPAAMARGWWRARRRATWSGSRAPSSTPGKWTSAGRGGA